MRKKQLLYICTRATTVSRTQVNVTNTNIVNIDPNDKKNLVDFLYRHKVGHGCVEVEKKSPKL